MSQRELAEKLGTSQNAVSRLENPAYGKPSLSTLKKYASFFDVGLIVRFAPLSEIVNWTTDLSPRSVEVPDFEHDAGMVEKMPSSSAASVDISRGNFGTGEEVDVSIGVMPYRRTKDRDSGPAVIEISSATTKVAQYA